MQYRASDIAAFPAQTLDVKTAIRFIKKHVEDYQIDVDRIFLFGDSSGGHTVLMTAFTDGMSEFDTDDYGEYSSDVRAVVDFYAPVDFTRMCEAPSTQDHTSEYSCEGLELGGKKVLENYDLAQKANPINYIKQGKAIPPMLIFHGSKDRIVPFMQSVLLFEKLKSVDADVKFYKLLGADHGGPQFWSDEIVDIITGFLEEKSR